MHMLDRFLFIVVHSNDDFRRGMVFLDDDCLQQESRAHTYLKTNQPHKHLFRNVTYPEIVHDMNLNLNVYKYMSKQSNLDSSNPDKI